MLWLLENIYWEVNIPTVTFYFLEVLVHIQNYKLQELNQNKMGLKSFFFVIRNKRWNGERFNNRNYCTAMLQYSTSSDLSQWKGSHFLLFLGNPTFRRLFPQGILFYLLFLFLSLSLSYFSSNDFYTTKAIYFRQNFVMKMQMYQWNKCPPKCLEVAWN